MLQTNEVSLVQRLFRQPLNSLSLRGRSRVKANEEDLVQSAYIKFREKYPKWAASCFDIYFLEHAGKEAVASKNAEALSKAYISQIPSINDGSNPENLAQVHMVAEAFLSILAAERKF